MPDLDDLLSAEIVDAASESARRPAIGSLVARGARRRRLRNGSVLVGAAVAVTVIALGAGQLRPAADREPTPGPRPTLPSATTAHESPSPSGNSRADDLAEATTVVKAGSARIAALVATPGSPDRRISEWYTCEGVEPCQAARYALTVTADGYRHSTVVALPVGKGFYGVAPAGPNHFVVTLGYRPVGVVDLHGHVRRISVGGARGPASGGETVSALARPPVAVDPATGHAHLLALPAGAKGVDDVSGRLWAEGNPSELFWSDDGGADWHPVALPRGAARKPYFVVPSADPSVSALVSGDFAVASNMRWDATLRSTDGGGFTSLPSAAPSGSSVAASGAAVLPDGRLLVLMTYWSSWQSGRSSPRAGFYTSTDWTHLQPVHMGAPFGGLSYSTAPALLGITTYGGVVTVYATPTDGSKVFSSTDEGATWTEVTAR